MKKSKPYMSLSFIGVILVVLLAGLVKTLVFPKDINYYENRYATKVKPLSISSYIDSSFQNSFNDALTDQVHFAQTIKKVYNTCSTMILKNSLSGILNHNKNKYISFMKLRIFGSDYITYGTRNLAKMTDALDIKTDNIKQNIKKFDDVDFYLYYIEKDTDINFETNKKVLAYEYIVDHIGMSDNRIAKFSIDSFDDFRKYFYKTDHHWKHTGSYEGYTQVMKLLGHTDVLKPVDEIPLSSTFSGSKASSSAATNVFNENFTAYKFNYPKMSIKINRRPVNDFGKQDAYFANKPDSISYGDFYGGDDGEIIFDTSQSNKENILILGESYDNAILKLVSSHFNKTYSVDLRNYKAQIGEDFRLSQYIKKNNISKVLLIGNIDYFTMKEFLLEG